MMKDSFENKGIEDEEEEDGGKESVEDFISEKSLQVTDDSGGNMNEFIIYEDPNKEDGCDDQARLIVAKSMQVHSTVKTGQSSTDNSKFHLPLNKTYLSGVTYPWNGLSIILFCFSSDIF